jgi:hypothetical protein
MKKRLGFKDYYESKDKLLAACDDAPRIRTEYILTKYCKFPIFESLEEDEREYIAFKPKDVIEILWERSSEIDEYPAAKCIILISEEGREVFPCWNNNKLHNWVNRNTNEL